MKFSIFLDDIRTPETGIEQINLTMKHLYKNIEWTIARNYVEFVNLIELHGLPEFVSFDHDLAQGHYHKNIVDGELDYKSDDFDNPYNRTGYHCAEYLFNLCRNTKNKLPFIFIHSQNNVGRENIAMLYRFFLKHQ
jgi:hypothetical protein